MASSLDTAHAWRAAHSLLLAVIIVVVPDPTGPPTTPDQRTTEQQVGAPSLTGCTKQGADPRSLASALSSAAPGDKICLTGHLADTRLTITRGGSASAPVEVVGDTTTTTKGITVEASNVIVNGVRAVNPEAPGILLQGSNITLANSSSISPRGGDGDGIRFFGDNIRIVHNTVSDVRNLGGAHADCMQTYTTGPDSPPSRNVLIDSNRCEKIDNQCLIAEGPNSSAGDGAGQGQSSDLIFSNNYCEAAASQAVWIDDVQNVQITHNEIAGAPTKAFGFQNKATGAVVAANKVAASVGFEVGMDASSRPGYQGPPVGGEP